VARAPAANAGGRARHREARIELVGAGVVTFERRHKLRGAAYPEKYRTTSSSVSAQATCSYRLQLTPDGPTFKAARVDGPGRDGRLDRQLVSGP